MAREDFQLANDGLLRLRPSRYRPLPFELRQKQPAEEESEFQASRLRLRRSVPVSLSSGPLSNPLLSCSNKLSFKYICRLFA